MDNNLIMIVFLMLLNKNKDKDKQNLDILIPDQYINIQYTMDKIEIMKKIGPYFPKDFHTVLNKSIVISEKIIKIHEIMDFLKKQETDYIKEEIIVKDNNERLRHISNIINRELNEGNIEAVGTTIETILDIERYKRIFSTLLPILSEPDSINSQDKMFGLIDVFMEGKSKEEKEKIKEMVKMLEIVKTLDDPKQNTTKETDYSE